MHDWRDAWHWRSLSWWLAVVTVAVLLKHHYSVALPADLDWMFFPLTQLLEWVGGHEFHRDGNYEWVSASADVRLVKACAGINFMLMSFMAYAWVLRPDRSEDADPLSWGAGQLLLLCAALIASWATCLLANTLRIIVAITARSRGWDLDVIGIDAEELHRLIGMVIYVPLLSLQMLPGKRSSCRQALAAPVLLYPLLMGVVPLLTGNALHHPALFIEHLQHLSVCLAAMCGMYFLCRQRWSGRRSGTARLRSLP